MTFLRRACAEAAAPRNKKRLSLSRYVGNGAFRHAFQRAARLEVVAKMTGRTPKMRTKRLKEGARSALWKPPFSRHAVADDLIDFDDGKRGAVLGRIRRHTRMFKEKF